MHINQKKILGRVSEWDEWWEDVQHLHQGYVSIIRLDAEPAILLIGSKKEVLSVAVAATRATPCESAE